MLRERKFRQQSYSRASYVSCLASRSCIGHLCCSPLSAKESNDVDPLNQVFIDFIEEADTWAYNIHYTNNEQYDKDCEAIEPLKDDTIGNATNSVENPPSIKIRWETIVKHVGTDALFNDIISSREYIEATSAIYEAIERLHNIGIGSLIIHSIADKNRSLSRTRIDDNNNITLPNYNNMSIEMPHMIKAIYLLFLRREEGILFKELPNYSNELTALYWNMIESDDEESVTVAIQRVTNPFSNAINEHCSRIKASFTLKFDHALACNYFIDGSRGMPKKISLPRKLVDWND